VTTDVIEDLQPLYAYVQQDSDMQPHLERLYDLTLEIKAKAVVELGTRYGMSTAALCHGAAVTGGHVYAVDIQCRKPFLAPNFSFIQGDDLNPYVLGLIPDTIDLLFIDTMHTLRQTVRELEVYGERVRPGGLVVCHDTCEIGVRMALWDFLASRGVHYREWPESYGLGVVTVGEPPED
jgi:predicted O-methyltransferase YrrM